MRGFRILVLAFLAVIVAVVLANVMAYFLGTRPARPVESHYVVVLNKPAQKDCTFAGPGGPGGEGFGGIAQDDPRCRP